jgi:hypothetical protein
MAITTKFGKAEFKFLITVHLPIEIYLPTKFLVDISYSLRVMSRTRFSNGEIIEKPGKIELWSLYTAHFPIEIYSPTQSYVDISYNFRDMFRTRFFYKGK